MKEHKIILVGVVLSLIGFAAFAYGSMNFDYHLVKISFFIDFFGIAFCVITGYIFFARQTTKQNKSKREFREKNEDENHIETPLKKYDEYDNPSKFSNKKKDNYKFDDDNNNLL